MKMKDRLPPQLPIAARVQFPLSVQNGKEVRELAYGFRGPEEEKAVLVQGIVEKRQYFFLQLGAEVNEQIPACYEIHPGKGRIRDYVLQGEHHHITYFLLDAVETTPLCEVTFEEFRRNISGNAFGIVAQSGRLDCLIIQISGENLD